MSMREKAGMLQRDNIQIRKANEKDAFILSLIDKECLSSECWSEKVFSENLTREDSITLIAECEGKEAGFINIIKVCNRFKSPSFQDCRRWFIQVIQWLRINNV